MARRAGRRLDVERARRSGPRRRRSRRRAGRRPPPARSSDASAARPAGGGASAGGVAGLERPRADRLGEPLERVDGVLAGVREHLTGCRAARARSAGRDSRRTRRARRRRRARRSSPPRAPRSPPPGSTAAVARPAVAAALDARGEGLGHQAAPGRGGDARRRPQARLAQRARAEQQRRRRSAAMPSTPASPRPSRRRPTAAAPARPGRRRRPARRSMRQSAGTISVATPPGNERAAATASAASGATAPGGSRRADPLRDGPASASMSVSSGAPRPRWNVACSPTTLSSGVRAREALWRFASRSPCPARDAAASSQGGRRSARSRRPRPCRRPRTGQARPHATGVVDRLHQVHLGRAGVGEADVDARGGDRTDQALGSVHGRGPYPRP